MRISVVVVSLLFLTLFSSICLSQTVGGIGGTSPIVSMVLPASPTTDDLITFKLTADGIAHSNQCVQMNALGGRSFNIIVDETTHTIQIGVTGTHSGLCLANYDPVNGLEGSVGPLAAGAWEIQTSFPGTSPPLTTFGEMLSFTVIPATVGELGDCNRDGVLNFLDIPPFVFVLLTSDYQVEADINEDGGANFLDIAPFVDLLSS